MNLEEKEELFIDWYEENELEFKKMKDNGYTEQAIMKKAFIYGLEVGKK